MSKEFEYKNIKLIVGLGNVGKTYRGSRHNAGFLFLDYLRDRFERELGVEVGEWQEENKFRSVLSRVNFPEANGKENGEAGVAGENGGENSGAEGRGENGGKNSVENAEVDSSGPSSLYLLKPTTMMNLSGQAVASVAKYFEIAPGEIMLAHDDLDLEFGRFKLQFGRGPREHNGVSSVEGSLATKDFWHLRIGVEGRDKLLKSKILGRDYVLQKFTTDEKKILSDTFSEVWQRYFEV